MHHVVSCGWKKSWNVWCLPYFIWKGWLFGVGKQQSFHILKLLECLKAHVKEGGYLLLFILHSQQSSLEGKKYDILKYSLALYFATPLDSPLYWTKIKEHRLTVTDADTNPTLHKTALRHTVTTIIAFETDQASDYLEMCIWLFRAYKNLPFLSCETAAVTVWKGTETTQKK